MNPEKYLYGVENLRSLQLVIVGKDPYPKDATDIPFRKADIKEQFKANCSGGVVLKAIGCNADMLVKKFAKDENGTLKIFEELRDAGIVFLNAIYRTDPTQIGRRICKARDLAALEGAYEKYNEPVLRKARRVIYCGEARKVQWIKDAPKVEDKRFHAVPHPDTRNSYSRHDKVRDQYKKWWSPGNLQREWNLELPGSVAT